MTTAPQGWKHLLRELAPAGVLAWRRKRLMTRQAQALGIRLRITDDFLDLERDRRVLRIRAAHAFYLEHMLENFDYYMDSVLPVRVGGKLLVDMSGPRYHHLKGFADIPFLFPSHTEPYGTTAEYLDFAQLRPGKIVLDIGAYSGVTSITFAQKVAPGGHVYAFEADEDNFACAQINVEMAGRVMNASNISLIPKAVWSHNDGILFSHEGAMGSSAVAITGGGRGTEKKVATTTLASFLHERAIPHLDFVKIDIEGGEIELLKDCAPALHAAGARVIVEPHFVNGAMSTDPCRQMLEAAGFAVHVRGKVGESEPLIEAEPRSTR